MGLKPLFYTPKTSYSFIFSNFKIVSKVPFLYYLIFEENSSLVLVLGMLYSIIESSKIFEEGKQVFARGLCVAICFLSYYYYYYIVGKQINETFLLIKLYISAYMFKSFKM